MQRYAKYRNYVHKNKLVQAVLHRWNQLNKKNLAKNLGLVAAALFFLGALTALAMYAWFSRSLPDPNDLVTREVPLSTKIYDRTGEHLLYEIAADEKRTLVTLEQVPDYLEQMTVVAEDRAFYEHHGISIKGILRAVFSNIVNLDATGQGASTITQQLVKNAILTTEKTYTRKIKEIILSLALERHYTKQEILQMYLNEIPYGSTNYGVESAAQAYFGKSVSDLSPAEAATIAAIPNRPSRLLNDPELLKSRRDWILDGMVEMEYMTREEADAAKQVDTTVTIRVTNIEAPHFVLWVKEQLEEQYSEREVEQGGLRVITTLDYDKQEKAEEALVTHVQTSGPANNFNNAGLISIDPKTGQVLAMVGSADYFNNDIDGQVNVTIQPLQPGSSIKPIIYTAAFEKGYTPNTILWDVDTTFPTNTGPYNPKNYSGLNYGYVTMRKALQGSLNIAAVKALYLVGVENALRFAERLGYTTFSDRSRFGLAIVLGGGEVKMIEHANAYAAFANDGVQHDVTAILKVEDPRGNVLQEWKAEEHEGKEVLDANLARTITNVLSDDGARAYIFGLGSRLTLSGRPVAAKTGTTNDYKDAWTVGYTPSIVTAVWVGNTDGSPMKSGSGSTLAAAPIWHNYMSAALAGTPVESFPSPSIPVTGKAMLDGTIPTTTYTIDTASGKLATDRTPEDFREEVSCGEFHSILHYVNKDNPTGDVPSNPENDAYYLIWENAIQAWIEKHNTNLAEGETKLVTCTDIPTEEDDVHTERNEPEISIRTPDNRDEVGRSFRVAIDVETRRDFGRVEYAIDGTVIAVSSSSTGEQLQLPSWVSSGDHTLTATVYDDVDNSKSDSITIEVTESTSSASFRITNPFGGQTIEKTTSTYNVIIEVPDADEITYLEVTATNTRTGNATVIGSTSSPSSITTLQWTIPPQGRYQLTARASDRDGGTLESTPVTVRVRDTLTPTSLNIPVDGITQIDL